MRPRVMTTGIHSLIVVIVLTSAGAAQAQVADIVFHGGPILTMSGDAPTYAEAVVVQGGKILFVGSKAEALRCQGPTTHVRDLRGNALLPGFLDAHSHYFTALTVADQVNVYAPPGGPGKDPASIVAALVKFRDTH